MWFLFALGVVVLLFMFPRPMLGVLGVGAVVGLIIGGLLYRESRLLANREEAVSVTVYYGPGECSVREPLVVDILNGSSATLSKISWVFSAKRAGYRGELTGGWLKEYSFDEELPPGGSRRVCYPPPDLGVYAANREADKVENLSLGIRSKRVSFLP